MEADKTISVGFASEELSIRDEVHDASACLDNGQFDDDCCAIKEESTC